MYRYIRDAGKAGCIARTEIRPMTKFVYREICLHNIQFNRNAFPILLEIILN